MAGENWTFWFNLTNFALGVITILAVLVVFAAVGWDLFGLWLHKARRADRVGVTGVDMERIAADLRAHCSRCLLRTAGTRGSGACPRTSCRG